MAQGLQSQSELFEWLDAIADRFEAEWRSGGCPSIAAYLGTVNGKKRRALLHELVQIDLEYRGQAGEARRLDDYGREFPELLGPDGTFPDLLIRHVRRVQEDFRSGSAAELTVKLSAAEEKPEPKRLCCPQCRNSMALPPGQREVTCPSCGNSYRLDPNAPDRLESSNQPRLLGPYQLLEVLGRGSFGTVYKARDADLDRWVAIKVPRAGSFASADEEARFVREARSAAQLVHPLIVPVYAIAREGDMPYIVSEYVEGQTLAGVLAQRRPGFREAAQLAAQIAEALDYAHRHQVIHRDIKPQNILLDAAGRPHLTDFGLARRDEGSVVLTLDGQLLGTPAYMAPEQAAGEQDKVDGRSDIYSLGVILYELLTGEPPFRGSVRMLLHQVVHDEPRPPRRLNDRIPRDLETICIKAMAKEPGRRYARARDLADDLKRFLKGEPIHARPVGRLERLGRWCRRNPGLAGWMAAAALLLLTGTGVSTYFIGQALEQTGETERAQKQAEEEKKLSDRRGYISAMRLARSYWEGNQIAWLRELLEEQRPEHTGGIDLRGFEWYYWQRLAHFPRSWKAHTAEFSSLAFSPDGLKLAAGSNDQTIRVWDVASGRVLFILRGQTHPVAFSPDGRYLSSAAEDDTVRLWDANIGKPVRLFPGHTQEVFSIAFSPDSRRLASAGKDKTVIIWETDSGKIQRAFHHPNRVSSIAFSPDDRWLASGGDDKLVRLWDASTGEEIRRFKSEAVIITSIAFSPDSQWLAGAGDQEVMIWNVAGSEGSHVLKGHTAMVSSVSYNHEGSLLASASVDQTVRLWDTSTARTTRILKGHTKHVESAVFSPDGRRLASAGHDKTVRIWDLTRDPEVLRLGGHAHEVNGVAFSPDGRHLASASGTRNKPNGEVKVWDLSDEREILSFRDGALEINSVSFSPDGTRLATAGDDHTVKLWDASTGRLERTFDDHDYFVWEAVFSPDGRRLASASEDGCIKVRDIASGREILTYRAKGMALGLAFSPDGKHLATAWCVDPQPIRVFDASNGQELRILLGHTQAIWSVAYSPDGRRLASASNDGTVRIWDATSGQQLFILKGHVRQVSGVSFSPDGKRLASAGWDGTVRIWDADSGQETLTLNTPGRVFRVAFSPDGRRLAAACWDQAVRVWEAPLVP